MHRRGASVTGVSFSVAVIVSDDHDNARAGLGNAGKPGLGAHAELSCDRLGTGPLVGALLVVHRGRRDDPPWVVADLHHRPTGGAEILRGPRGQTADGAVVVDPYLAAAGSLPAGRSGLLKRSTFRGRGRQGGGLRRGGRGHYSGGRDHRRRERNGGWAWRRQWLGRGG